MKNSVRVYQGVAYFPTFDSARDFGAATCQGFPAWRVVGYERGHAVQVRPGGDYLGPNGRPSMENAMDAFFNA
jgi:hypothetical protein